MGGSNSCDSRNCPANQCARGDDCHCTTSCGIMPAKAEQGIMIDGNNDKESTESSILMRLNQIEIDMRYIIYILIIMIIIWVFIKVLNCIKARSSMRPFAKQSHKPMKLTMTHPESDDENNALMHA